ncbi:microsomal signal peptidase 12 kDa subunit-domain-containing protein [Rhodocollybia butyracea]|uniref:Signal peptidase complex subunit 1 n=1 Tax=Rhodocollybia butyracea TaxID=206335 RepID=A0A9P5Q616_9AGAR|nr:microsomal signal peptidase 12 kDa subunit-domain-containing protein [Rhodocollybia butyracea]
MTHNAKVEWEEIQETIRATLRSGPIDAHASAFCSNDTGHTTSTRKYHCKAQMDKVILAYFEGKIDFVGQQYVEEIARMWLISFAALSFILGYVFQSMKLTFGLLGASTVVLFAIVLPPWRMFNSHPVKWLPSKSSQDGDVDSDNKKRKRN